MLVTSTKMNIKDENHIYIQESLTHYYTSELLAKAKEKAKRLRYKYPGYIVKGQVRVKKEEGADPIHIRCISDIEKKIL